MARPLQLLKNLVVCLAALLYLSAPCNAVDAVNGAGVPNVSAPLTVDRRVNLSAWTFEDTSNVTLPMAPGNISTVLATPGAPKINTSLSIFDALMAMAGGGDKSLMGTVPATYFVPSNSAFRRFIANAGFSGLTEMLVNSSFVKDIVKYHVLANFTIVSTDFPSFGGLLVPTLLGPPLYLKHLKNGTLTVTDARNRTGVLLAVDVPQGSEAAVHVINRIMLPPREY
ncbi:hypothetical protein V8C86DRAFT_2553796 [Haematococcus lacustris]